MPVCVEDTWQPALQFYLESLNAEWTFDGESDLSVSRITHDRWAVAFKESALGSQITSGCLRGKNKQAIHISPFLLPQPVFELEIWESHPFPSAQGNHRALNRLEQES